MTTAGPRVPSLLRALTPAAARAAFAAAVLATALVAGSAPAKGATSGPATLPGLCQAVRLPVALAAGYRRSQTLAGTLCRPLSPAPGPPAVDVLTSGATYNQMYWNWPVDWPRYSFVDRDLLAGRATFAYDRIGSGSSSRPASLAVTVRSDAYTLHQAVTWLHGEGFAQVDSIGHSLGSVVVVQEAAVYHDVSRVVLTSFLHTPNLGYLNLAAFLYPAALDPQFLGRGLDLGYLTTVPGARSVMYSPSASPAVISYDEAHKDVASAAELATAVAQVEAPPPLNVSEQVTAPVLVVVGTRDAIMCGGPIPDCADAASVRSTESPYYLAARSVSVAIVSGAGHDLALDPTAGVSFADISGWIRRTP